MEQAFTGPLAAAGPTLVRDESLHSAALGRGVTLDVLLPPGYDLAAAAPYPVLFLNDGQDLARLRVPATLASLYRQQALRPFVLVAIHANEDRLHDYGTAGQPDYQGRGSRADKYSAFVRQELRPYAQQRYHLSLDPADVVVAGFSLGGLAAFDLAWHHPELFGRAGVFSGSFWWRRRELGEGYSGADRLMHQRVRGGGPAHPAQQFWLQVGTLDEANDRDHNGVIDAIDDTLDLMEELRRRQFDVARNLRYVQVEGGRHHPDTWGRVLPDFLLWAFGTGPQAARLLPAPLAVVRRQFAPTPPPDLSVVPALVPDAVLRPPVVLPPTALRPAEDEYATFYAGYVDLVPAGADALTLLREQPAQLRTLAEAFSEEQASRGYAPGKWSLKELLLHIADAERVFSYRALRFARGDAQALLSFDENDYVAASGANARPLADILAEYEAVRAATLTMFGSFGAAQLARLGTASGHPVSVRALLFITAGHEIHHLRIIEERYRPALAAEPVPTPAEADRN